LRIKLHGIGRDLWVKIPPTVGQVVVTSVVTKSKFEKNVTSSTSYQLVKNVKKDAKNTNNDKQLSIDKEDKNGNTNNQVTRSKVQRNEQPGSTWKQSQKKTEQIWVSYNNKKQQTT
jgi:hypothetical protein